MPVLSVSNRFDASKTQRNIQGNRYDAVMADRLTRCSLLFESGAKYNGHNTNRFDAENITSDTGTVMRFASEGRGLCKTAGSFAAVRVFEHPIAGVTGKFTLTRSWNTGAVGRFQAIRPSRQMATAKFDAIIFLKHVATSGLFDAKTKMFKTLPNFFDIMPGYQRVKTPGLFDSSARTTAALSAHKHAFVQSGWRIQLRNVETNQTRDLGFVSFDAVEKTLTDVEIPDGDYEVTLLYSSLFWKNAIDRIVRNVTIRSGEEPTFGLPPILNLRSEIESGITRILWDSETGFEDVTFGLWFAESPPVVTFREPDQSIAYTVSELEYEVNFTQTLPIWCVVMAIKGNMLGPASEIFLPWSNESPRRPDDQMAFDVFLDEKLQQLKNATGQGGDDHGEWNTENGYW